jgi:hypothetical protein
MELLLVLIIPAVAAVALAVLLDRFWSGLSSEWAALIAGLPVPVLVLAMFAAMALDRSPEDRHGLVFATSVLVGPLLGLLAFAIGLGAGYGMLRLLRRGRSG